MKLDDSFEEFNKGKNTYMATIISIVVCFTVVLIVLFANRDRIINKNVVQTDTESVEAESVSMDDPYKDYSVEDLDFFNMFDETGEKEVIDAGYSEHIANEDAKDEVVLDETNDGKHTMITYSDGKTEWVSISSYLTKHNYDFTNLINSNGKMKYFEDGRCISYLGIDITKDNDYIDFVKVLKYGVKFCMVRVALRGYQSGDLVYDDYYADNIRRANDAGLSVGVYFVSSAINIEEAEEEADYLLSLINGYSITYPVCFVMESPKNDNARTDELTKAERTEIARAFLDKIKASGYKPMLYGNKEWLIKNYDMSKLINDYDIWLSEKNADIPTYPYKFAMWQYSGLGAVDGIAGNVNMDISFIDYSLK